MVSTAIDFSVENDMPYLLFSQMKTTGSFQIAARLTASWNAPSLVAPSPKKQATTWSSPRSW